MLHQRPPHSRTVSCLASFTTLLLSHHRHPLISTLKTRAFVQRFGLGITTLIVVKVRQMVQERRNIGIIGTKCFFRYCQ